jgi:hypothetical protein
MAEVLTTMMSRKLAVVERIEGRGEGVVVSVGGGVVQVERSVGQAGRAVVFVSNSYQNK